MCEGCSRESEKISAQKIEKQSLLTETEEIIEVIYNRLPTKLSARRFLLFLLLQIACKACKVGLPSNTTMYLVARSAFLLLLHFLKLSDGFCPRACQCNEEALSGNNIL